MRRLNEPLDSHAHHDLRSILKQVADLDKTGGAIPENVALDFLDTATMTYSLQLRRSGVDDRQCLTMLRDRLEKFQSCLALLGEKEGF